MTSLERDIRDISDISKLVNNARESPNFDIQKIVELLDLESTEREK